MLTTFTTQVTTEPVTTEEPVTDEECITPVWENEQECTCIDGVTKRTFTRECPECLGSDCESQREEVCDVDLCAVWSDWDEGSCVDNSRTRSRACMIGTTVVDNSECPSGDVAAETIVCTPWTQSSECSCNGQDGTLSYTCVGGTGLAADDICVVNPDESCNEQCGMWGEWEQWSQFYPSCVDNLNDADTLLNDLDIHRPERYRERDCLIKDASTGLNATITDITDQAGCKWQDKHENEEQADEDIKTCEHIFAGDAASDDTLIATKAVVDFELRLYEQWSDDLDDTTSTEFEELAEKYEHGLQETLVAISETSDPRAKYSFATIRVMKFSKIQESAIFETNEATRKRRDGSADEINAEFETVFKVLGEKDNSESSGVDSSSADALNNAIKDDVAEGLKDATSRTVADQGGYKAGELNFFRQATEEDIQPIVFENSLLASYETITDCDCATKKRADYKQCKPVPDRDVCIYLFYI